MVGQVVIQLARERGIRTVNVIRRRPPLAHESVVERLKSLGGDLVVTDDTLGTPAFRQMVEQLGQPRLALNATGGESATAIARTLQYASAASRLAHCSQGRRCGGHVRRYGPAATGGAHQPARVPRHHPPRFLAHPLGTEPAWRC